MLDDGQSDNEDDGTTEDACVRLKGGIDIQQLMQNDAGVEFEVMDGAAPSKQQYFFEDREVIDSSTGEDRSKSHWNPEKNDEDAEIFYEENAFDTMMEKMEDITPERDSGIMKQILEEGQGQVVPNNALVCIHYNAFHEHAKTPFDSTRLRGQAQRFQLDNGDVIPGLDISVSTMKKKELSRFIIQPSYAFGHMGCGPRIPGKSPIMFEIELLNFFEAEGSERFFAMPYKERNELPFDQILKHIRTDKEAAKDLFCRHAFREAIGRYLRCIRVLESISLMDDQQETDQQSLMRILCLNTAQCYLNLSRPARTVTYARKALYINSEDCKALFKLGKALRLLGDFDRAREFLERAHRHRPTNREIAEELGELEKSVQKFNKLEREQCRRMFSGGGLSDSLPASRRADSANGSEEISQEFKDAVAKNLNSFVDDSDLIEILAGNGNRLTDVELSYILEEAQKKGLFYRYDTAKSEIYLTKHQRQ